MTGGGLEPAALNLKLSMLLNRREEPEPLFRRASLRASLRALTVSSWSFIFSSSLLCPTTVSDFLRMLLR